MLLQKGIFAEETEENLDAVNKIYDGIVEEAEVKRALVAKTLSRLGVCPLRKGQTNGAKDQRLKE